MANKYLDLSGLQRLVNKIKEIIPTRTSELENDKGFITLEEVPSYDPSAVKRFQEKFTVESSSVFNFTKGQYTLGGNFVNWYLDGIKQSNDTLIEINETTIEVVGGLPQGATVVFDYLEYTNVIAGVQGPKGDTFTFDDLTQEQINALTGPEGPPGPAVEVVDDLETYDTTKALSAKQGAVLFQSVSNGKNLIATAITDKGINASGSDTFEQLANLISQIETVMWGNYRNVALEGTATASSSLSTIYTPEKAIDGNKTTADGRWISDENDLSPWLEINLKQACKIDRIDLYSGHKYPNVEYIINQYVLQYWNGSTWIDIVNVSGNTNYQNIHTFNSEVTDKVRLQFEAGSNRVYEVEIFGETIIYG